MSKYKSPDNKIVLTVTASHPIDHVLPDLDDSPYHKIDASLVGLYVNGKIKQVSSFTYQTIATRLFESMSWIEDSFENAKIIFSYYSEDPQSDIFRQLVHKIMAKSKNVWKVIIGDDDLISMTHLDFYEEVNEIWDPEKVK